MILVEVSSQGGKMADYSLYTLLLALVGFLSILFFLLENIWSLLQAIRSLLAPYFIPNEETTLAKKFGPWALVTGSTDGIGKAYSFELAKRGINIVLVSRNEERLRNTAREIESMFSVKTKIIAADFSVGLKAVEIVKDEIGKLPIDILVNNVGKMYEYPTFLTEVPERDIVDIININVGAATLLCKFFLEGMKQRRRGAIVNVSSGSEHQPLPFMTVYAATKAYMKSFTAALRFEYQRYGITVQHLVPMFVDTKMNAFSEKVAKDKLFVVSPQQYAKYAVATLGKMDESSGHWAHGIQTLLVKLPPPWIRTYVGARINLAFRKEYLSRIKSGSRTPEEVKAR